jgi:hypothetical protein
MRGHGLRVLELAAVLEIGRDAGRPKRVIADLRGSSPVRHIT